MDGPSRTRQRRIDIVAAVRDLTTQGRGVPPTIREVSEATGIPRSSVYRHVSALWDLGLLKVGRGRRAGVVLTASTLDIDDALR